MRFGSALAANDEATRLANMGASAVPSASAGATGSRAPSAAALRETQPLLPIDDFEDEDTQVRRICDLRPPIEAVGVVVPAKDEAALLPRCLAALDVALARLPAHVRRLTVMVLDDCEDASPRIVGNWCSGAPGWAWAEVAFRNVGRARAAGMQHILGDFADVDPSRIWLASTDADSVVPPDWLTAQLGLADTGADAVAGTIEVDDWREFPAGFGERFRQFYAAQGTPARHGHVHGANLGVRAAAYLAVGGFAPLASGEDHALWKALCATSCAPLSSRLAPVTTSGRRSSRAPGCFSGFLTALSRAA